MLKWTLTQLPLRIYPTLRSAKICDILPGKVLELTGESESDSQGNVFDEVEYQTNLRKFTGWVPRALLENFNCVLPNIIKDDAPTLDASDGAQYLLSPDGRTWFNLCGEYAVCYCAGWEYSMEAFLEQWKSTPLSAYGRIFKGGLSMPTGISDLDNMLDTFEGYTTPSVLLQKALYEPLLNRVLVTPGRLKSILLDNRVIISCSIETQKGRLRSSGSLHWVVVESVTPERCGGNVRIYNPFPDTMEDYPWDFFMQSVGVPYGILVER